MATAIATSAVAVIAMPILAPSDMPVFSVGLRETAAGAGELELGVWV